MKYHVTKLTAIQFGDKIAPLINAQPGLRWVLLYLRTSPDQCVIVDVLYFLANGSKSLERSSSLLFITTFMISGHTKTFIDLDDA